MIHYLKGDATKPQGEGHKIIVHVVNDHGTWGKGFVLALSRLWKLPESRYKKWAGGKLIDNPPFIINSPFELGEVQFVKVEDNITVANMLAQEGYKSKANPVAVKYDALERCLKMVSYIAILKDASLHMPKIGCGLGGGSWDKVESIIQNITENVVKETQAPKDIDVFVYDLELAELSDI